MKNILVTGANGQLGSELQELLRDNDSFNVLFADRNTLNIADRAAVDKFFLANRINIVINCAAYTAVDKAESEQQLCYTVNERGVQNIAMACDHNEAFLIHISTDFVFSGETNIPLTENNMVNPKNIYGTSKLAGERMIKSYVENHIIIRTSWLYSSFGNNFVKTILQLAKEKESLNIVFDQIGTPTYARDLAQVILQLLQRENLRETRGTFHYSNEGVASWYDFAVAIAEISELKTPIFPIESSQYKTPAQRPKYSVLNKQKIKTTFGIEIPHWRKSLTECIAKMKAKNI